MTEADEVAAVLAEAFIKEVSAGSRTYLGNRRSLERYVMDKLRKAHSYNFIDQVTYLADRIVWPRTPEGRITSRDFPTNGS